QIGEDQPVALLDRVPGLAHLVLEQAAVRFAGLLQAATLGVELPAVVAAADTIVFDLAIIKSGAAMAAARMQEPGAAAPVAKQDQVLAKDAHFSGDIGGVGLKPNRVPVAAQKLAHRRSPADRRQLDAGRG